MADQDTPPHFKGETVKNIFRLLDIDLTGATVVAKVYKPSGTTLTKDCTVLDAITGQVMWTTGTDGVDFNEVGEYIEQHIITYGTNARRTGPMETFYVNDILVVPEEEL